MPSASDSNNKAIAPLVHDFEFISVAASLALVERHWERIIRGLLTLKKLKGFFGHLGIYLKAVKARGVDAAAVD